MRRTWKLLEAIAGHTFLESLPPFSGGVANAGRRFLLRQEAWQPLKYKGCSIYSFRQAYAERIHIDPRYNQKISTRQTAVLMGHNHQVHLENYGEGASTSLRRSIQQSLSNEDID